MPLLLFSGTPRAISVGIAGLILINIAFLFGRAAVDDSLAAIELHDALPAMVACPRRRRLALHLGRPRTCAGS